MNIVSSVQFSHSVMSDSLQPHGLQHARLLCPPVSPGMHAGLVAQLCLTPCHPTDCSLSGYSVHGILQARILEWVAIIISWSLVKFMSTELVMLSNHLILYYPLLLPSVFPSIRVFSNKSALCIRWPKYWSFSFSISPSSEYSGLISFRINWFDLLVVQATLKNFLWHHNLKALILWHSAFFIVQLSHPYMTTGKTIALTRRTFVGKVMSLLLYAV